MYLVSKYVKKMFNVSDNAVQNISQKAIPRHEDEVFTK